MNACCFTQIALVALACFATAILRAEDLDARKVVATVNGDPVTYADVTAAIPASEQTFADARKTALEKLIDKALLIHAARKLGVVPASILDERIQSIVDQEFHGDKAAFETKLEKQGYTLEKFRKFQEETILLQVMRKIITHGETNPVARDEQMATWLTAARAEAKINYP
jgi:hypothetical protein